MHIYNIQDIYFVENLLKISALFETILNGATRHRTRALMTRKYSAKPGLSINDKKLSQTPPM